MKEHHLKCSWRLPVPWDLSEIKPSLHVYSSQLEEAIVIKHDDDIPTAVDRLLHANVFNTPSLIFITHGFENDINSPWVPVMKDSILSASPEATVILLDWGGGASIGILKYSQAAANTQTVGGWLGGVVKEIRKSVPAKKGMKIWGIAHSLGAHLIGLAGRQSEAFDRITGLDPAGPSFEKVNQENRLCRTDAAHVDVIHTDGYDSVFDPEDWFAPVNHYGTLIPLGKIDFYPNYGYSQPGAGVFTIAGSHHRAIELFVWSITNPGKLITNTVLVGMPEFEKPVKEVKYVAEHVEMGYHFNGICDGLFYIETAAQVPWKSGEDSSGSENGQNGYFSSCNIL